MGTCSKDTGALPWAQGHSGLGPGAGDLPGDLAAVPGGLPARLLFPCRRRRRRLYGPRWPQRQSGRGWAVLWQPTSPVPRHRIRRGRLSFSRCSSTAGDRHTSTSRCFRLKRWLPGCHSRAEERVSFQLSSEEAPSLCSQPVLPDESTWPLALLRGGEGPVSQLEGPTGSSPHFPNLPLVIFC